MEDLNEQIQRIVSVVTQQDPELMPKMEVRRAWDAVAADQMKAHVDGLFIKPNTEAGELIVYTDDAIHAADFNMQSELVRLKLNVALAGTDEDAVARSDDDALLDVPTEAPERIKKLTFYPSKEGYQQNREVAPTLDDAVAAYDTGAGTPAQLDEETEERLASAAAEIEDEGMRAAALEAARASLMLEKGIECADSKKSSENVS
ncbi:MAG: hypothetical protein LUD25_01870 [Coriobacteriaceae bacterium]|nr:hypothetical protein [Coriobacteriaceae bacterium]